MNIEEYQNFAREKLGFEFHEPMLLVTALTHRSYLNEHRSTVKEHNERLDELREIGVKISLDDFGTGFSSLSYLKGLPIDTLKIDKTFVDTLLTDVNTKIIMESIIYMVKRLGYETIAEGVETEGQFQYLKELGCDIIQGYYLGRPMPAEEIEDLLADLTAKV